MKEKTFIITACILFGLCMGMLVFFRTVPAFRIWENYTVFYTDNAISENTVYKLFSEAGINGVLSAKHAFFPPLSSFAPMQYNNLGGPFAYEDLQNAFFSDKRHLFNLYYVPQEYTAQAAAALKHTDFVWGTDAGGGIPFIVPAVLTVMFICSVFFAKKRLFFSLVFFPLFCYGISVPLYHISCFVCLTGYAFFIMQKYWDRPYFFKRALIHPLFLSSLILLTLVSAVSGIRAFLLFIAAAFASVNAAYILMKITDIVRKNAVFNPLPIASARIINVGDILSLRFALIPAVSICILFFFIFIKPPVFAVFNGVSKPAALFLPGPVKKTLQKDFSSASYTAVSEKLAESERLPDLSDFINAFWHIETYPFRKLSENAVKNPQIGEKVEYSDYKKEGNGLREVTVTAAVFDDLYIERVCDLARHTAFAGGAEKLLSCQRGFMRTAYVRIGTENGGAHSFVFTLCAFIYILVLLALIKYRAVYRKPAGTFLRIKGSVK